MAPSQEGTAFGVSRINPVDIYQQAMRSVKYGNLIVLLTFTAFFSIEMVRRLMLHPTQYLLVGLALVIFFLLLLALSEHIPFWAAYLIVTIACVGLVASYTASALGGISNSGAYSAGSYRCRHLDRAFRSQILHGFSRGAPFSPGNGPPQAGSRRRLGIGAKRR